MIGGAGTSTQSNPLKLEMSPTESQLQATSIPTHVCVFHFGCQSMHHRSQMLLPARLKKIEGEDGKMIPQGAEPHVSI
eukprot:5920008-Amphidinium_carterae.1